LYIILSALSSISLMITF